MRREEFPSEIDDADPAIVPSNVVHMVDNRFPDVSLCGIVGLAGAVGVGYIASAILFEMKAWDPVVLAVSAVLLAVVAFAAGFVPARRASLIDPMRALRYE